jgi:TetR/AcrR family transcriptional regulator
VEDVQRRQAAGELTREFDAGFVLLVLTAAIAAPVSLPEHVRRIYGADPRSPAFIDPYRRQLQGLFAPRANEAGPPRRR